jgi:hypothetical protein
VREREREREREEETRESTVIIRDCKEMILPHAGNSRATSLANPIP